MVASINASTSAGVVTTADTSGILALQTAGTTALTLDASQNATFAGSVKTNTLTSASATALTLQSAGTTAITVDTSQNVSINTTSTNTKLNVGGGLTTILGTNARGGWDGYVYSSTNSYDGVRWNSWRARGTSASPTAVQSGDELASWQISGYSNSSSYSYAGGIFVVATGTVSGSNVPSYMSFETSSSSSAVERMRIDSSGNFMVGTSSVYNSAKVSINQASAGSVGMFIYKTVAGDVGTAGLQIGKTDNNTTTSQVFIQFLVNTAANANGQINANGASQAAFGTYSDSRLKENITNLPSQLANIMALRPVEFDYIESEGGGHQIGFVAQEVKEIYPDLVGERADGMFTLSDLNKNDARLIKAIQELKAINDTQAETINALTARIVALEK